VLPTLARLGLLGERIAPKYRQLVEETMISGFEGTTFDGSLSLPDDLEAWVDETGG
jgi:ATP-dependent protease HslVU (ClpYQ) peptidase subunit